MLNDALELAPTVVTALGPDPATLVPIRTVIAHVAPTATFEHVLAVTLKSALNPERPLKVIGVLPSLRKVTLVVGAGDAPYQRVPRFGAALVSVATLAKAVTLTGFVFTTNTSASAVPMLASQFGTPAHVPPAPSPPCWNVPLGW